MDISLDKYELIGGSEQVKQSVELLLKNHVGSWCHSYAVGSYVNLHEDGNTLTDGVYKTLEQLPYVTTNSVEIVGNRIGVSIEYNGDDINLSVVL